MTDQDREDFETWASGNGWTKTMLAKSRVDGRYAWTGLNSAWKVWQAARTPSQAPAPGDAGVVEALRIAQDHIDMEALRISHCKDAAIIEATLSAAPHPAANLSDNGACASEVEGKAGDAAPQPARCGYCDGSGDVHSIDGEWRGTCTECDAAAWHYATRLAESLHAKHYGAVTTWKPLPDLLGLLTQIDNMVATLSAAPTPPQPAAQPGEEALNAARYEWLRSRLPGSAYRIAGVIYSEGGAGVDAAVDAARAAQAQGDTP